MNRRSRAYKSLRLMISNDGTTPAHADLLIKLYTCTDFSAVLACAGIVKSLPRGEQLARIKDRLLNLKRDIFTQDGKINFRPYCRYYKYGQMLEDVIENNMTYFTNTQIQKRR